MFAGIGMGLAWIVGFALASWWFIKKKQTLRRTLRAGPGTPKVTRPTSKTRAGARRYVYNNGITPLALICKESLAGWFVGWLGRRVGGLRWGGWVNWDGVWAVLGAQRHVSGGASRRGDGQLREHAQENVGPTFSWEKT